MKKNKVVGFVKDNKKEIVIAIVGTVVGAAAGFIGYKCHIAKNYGELIDIMSKFKSCPNTKRTVCQDIVEFLSGATHSFHPFTAKCDTAIKDTFCEEIVSILANKGHNPDMLVSGILIGLKNK